MPVRQAQWAPLSIRGTPSEAVLSICRFRNRRDRTIRSFARENSAKLDEQVVFTLPGIADS